MEKLEKKHNHKLTDLLKVGIFGLMLLLPFLIFLPTGCYYGHNEHATTTRVEPIKVDFNQKLDDFTTSTHDEKVNTSVNEKTITLDFNDSGYGCYAYFNLTKTFEIIKDHKYLYKQSVNTNLPSYTCNVYFGNNISTIIALTFNCNTTTTELISTATRDYTQTRIAFYLDNTNFSASSDFINFHIQLFDLTQMYGYGNEPTIEQFNETFTKEYYDYTVSEEIIINHPESITWSMYYSWEDLWNTPLFGWTNTSILRTGLKNFVTVFGVNDTAYITNLITYELIIVAIYIVIDIVIEIFKWLTHLIGEK